MFQLLLISVVAISGIVYGRVLDPNPCTKAGLYPVTVDATAFYSCGLNKAGGLTFTYHYCPDNELFNAQLRHCVSEVELRHGVANSFVQLLSDTTEEPATEESLTEEPVTEAPGTTDAPITDDAEKLVTTDGPSTEEPEEPVTTDNPETEETDNPNSSESPSTEYDSSTENTEATDDPSSEDTAATNDPTTEEPSTDQPSTDDPETSLCSAAGFFPISCDKFIYCTGPNGDHYELQCPEGQHFNPTAGFCGADYDCED